MKQILTPTKPFCADRANVPKPFIVKEVEKESRLGATPVTKGDQTGDDNDQSDRIYCDLPRRGLRCPRNRHIRIFRLGCGCAADPAFPAPFFLVPQTQMAPPPTVGA